MSDRTPSELANMDQAIARTTSDVKHYIKFYTDLRAIREELDALSLSARHILQDHNVDVTPERRAVEMSIAVRMIHDLQVQLATLENAMKTAAPTTRAETGVRVADYVETYHAMVLEVGQDTALVGMTGLLALHKPDAAVTAMAVRLAHNLAYRVPSK